MISRHQVLSEMFIREFLDRLHWIIYAHQQLSESFIREVQDRNFLLLVSRYQPLSTQFIDEIKHKLTVPIQLKHHHRKVDPEEIEIYANKYGLKYEDGILYTYRKHTKRGCSRYNNKNKRYQPGIYYRYWRCDLDPKNMRILRVYTQLEIAYF
jgi:hypothetical protein